MNPDPEHILIEDIAHALSPYMPRKRSCKNLLVRRPALYLLCEGGMGKRAINRMALACLLHDASECYMSDIPRPYKNEMPEYRKRENALLEIIYTIFLGSPLNEEEQRQLKEIDDAMLWYDLENLLDEMRFGEIPELHIDLDYAFRPFRDVEKEYLDLFYLYSGEEQPKPVFLEDIVDAFESCMDEWSQFLNKRTGEIVSVPNDPGLTGLDEDKELWEEIEESDYFIRLPEQRELHEKRIMEDFTDTCTSGSTANRLWRALNGKAYIASSRTRSMKPV